jgi:hypothetical protein
MPCDIIIIIFFLLKLPKEWDELANGGANWLFYN